MRRWLWVLCLVACSRRIERFHETDAGLPDSSTEVDAGGCPQASTAPALSCGAAFGLPNALSGEPHVMSRLADMNGDTKLDLISPEIDRNRVAVAFGRGDGTFGTASYYAVGNEPVSLDVGDLDGDGDRDIVVGAQATADLSILKNDGGGMFTATTLTVSTARTVTIARIDADTRPDLVVASATAQTVSVVLATATGYAAPVVYNLGFTVLAAAVGDVDNDGDLDIVAVGTPTKAVVLKGTGAGAFTMTTTMLTEDGNDVTIADVDGDGKREIAIATPTAIDIYDGTGLGAFTSKTPFAFRVAKGITAADLDNDGHADIAAVGWEGMAIIIKGPTGYSKTPVPLELPAQGPEQVTTGDVDGDGRIDIVTSSVSNRNNGVLILRNTGAVPTPTLLGSGPTSSGKIADLDGDSHNDFVRVTPSAFQIYMQAAGSLVTDGVQYPASGTVGIGDVTADGIADIVVASSTMVSIFRGTGQGHFALAGTYPVGGYVSEVHIVDLGDNCAPEIVLVHPSAPPGVTGPHSQTLAVMRNHGNGTFDPEYVYPVPGISSATLGDFDQDGKLDVVAGTYSPLLAFLHGNGDSTLRDPVTSPATSTTQLFSADIDGDGHRDLLMSTTLSGPSYLLGTLRGHGDGSFDGAILQPSMTLTTSNSMRVLDFNGDGALDVVFKNDVGLGVHKGHPNGTFDAALIYQLPGTPLDVGDLDNDKRADTVFVRDVQAQITPFLYELRGTCSP